MIVIVIPSSNAYLKNGHSLRGMSSFDVNKSLITFKGFIYIYITIVVVWNLNKRGFDTIISIVYAYNHQRVRKRIICISQNSLDQQKYIYA